MGYSINATLLNAFASTTRAFRRQPESWPLVSLGAPKVRWQDDLEFVTEVIGELQKGCLARMVGAEGEEEVGQPLLRERYERSVQIVLEEKEVFFFFVLLARVHVRNLTLGAYFSS